MSKLIAGNTYLYRGLIGTYHVDVLKTWWLFALCMYRVDNIDFGYSYYKTRWKPSWRIF